MCNDRLMDKIKDIPLLFLTGSHNRPDTLTPTHTGAAASALGDPSVNDHRTNLPLCPIIVSASRPTLRNSVIWAAWHGAACLTYSNFVNLAK